MDNPVIVGFFALCKNNMFLHKDGDATAASQMVLAAAFRWCPNSVPSGCIAGLGDAMDSSLVQLVFLDHDDIKTHGAKEGDRFLGASYIGRDHLKGALGSFPVPSPSLSVMRMWGTLRRGGGTNRPRSR